MLYFLLAQHFQENCCTAFGSASSACCLLKPISKKIFCVWYAVLCCCFFFQTVKQKAYSLHENLDQLSNLNIGFMSPLYLFHLTDSYSS